MEIIVDLLILQGVLGAGDVLVNHEWKEGLPSRPECALEQSIHAMRELLYGVIFMGLAWFQWQGIFAWLLALILLVEILLTAWDFLVEDRTRRLPPGERLAHLILSIIGGAYLALLVPHLLAWSGEVSKLKATEYGISSWILTLLGTGVIVWGIRDLLAGVRLSLRAAPAADFTREG